MNTLISCLALVTSQLLTVLPPAAAVSVGRATSAFLVVGSVRPPRRPQRHRADSPGLHAWIEIPPWMGRSVTWTFFDVNGRLVVSGTAEMSEAGPRRLSWDRGDVPAAGLYAVRCIDEHGQYTTASVVIPPN